MKSLVLSFFLINILSIFDLVFGANDGEDCKKFNTFLGRDSNASCCGNHIECDSEGYFLSLTMSKSDVTKSTDFSTFPIFSKLTKLAVGIPNINNNVLPSRFFEQPSLSVLEAYESSISSIPETINTNSPVIEINLEHNAITEFPYHFAKLPNLQHLYLMDNKIPGVIDLKDFKTLDQIDVGKNQVVDMINIPSDLTVLYLFENPITEIPKDVPALQDLSEFDVHSTKISELPPDLFKLNNLKKFHIYDNPQLNTALINFGEKKINDCKIDGTTITCLQPNTCISISESQYNSCTEDQINEIKNKQSKIPLQAKNKSLSNSDNGDHKNPNNNFDPKIIGAIGILFLGLLCLLGFVITQKKKKKNNKKEDKYDIVVFENRNRNNNPNTNNPSINNGIIISNNGNRTNDNTITTTATTIATTTANNNNNNNTRINSGINVNSNNSSNNNRYYNNYGNYNNLNESINGQGQGNQNYRNSINSYNINNGINMNGRGQDNQNYRNSNTYSSNNNPSYYINNNDINNLNNNDISNLSNIYNNNNQNGNIIMGPNNYSSHPMISNDSNNNIQAVINIPNNQFYPSNRMSIPIITSYANNNGIIPSIPPNNIPIPVTLSPSLTPVTLSSPVLPNYINNNASSSSNSNSNNISTNNSNNNNNTFDTLPSYSAVTNEMHSAISVSNINKRSGN